MTGVPLAVAWLMTVLFCGTLVLCLWAAARAATWRPRLSYLAHAAMSAVMALMPWSWYAHLPPTGLLILFVVGAVWFALIAVGPRRRPIAGSDGPEQDHHSTRGFGLYHAAMMASMGWMVLAMASSTASATMASGSTMAMGSPTTGGLTTMVGTSAAGRGLSLALGVAYLVAAVWFICVLGRESRGSTARRHRFAGVLNLAMALGMAVSFLVLMP